MKLTKIKIKNYKLLTNVELCIDEGTTVIVGRNNSGKTSFMQLMHSVYQDRSILSFNDFSIEQRGGLYSEFLKFLKEEETYDEFRGNVPCISIEYEIDYSDEKEDASLGALSPFIVDLDSNQTKVKVLVRYEVDMGESRLRELGSWKSLNEVQTTELTEFFRAHFGNIFSRKIYAVHPSPAPNQKSTRVLRSFSELQALIPIYFISAERYLDEGEKKGQDSLPRQVSKIFNSQYDLISDKEKDKVEQLQQVISDLQEHVKQNIKPKLDSAVKDLTSFGYDEIQIPEISLQTDFDINDILKNNSKLTYKVELPDGTTDYLPSSSNGLGYKNLIKLTLDYHYFCAQLNQKVAACIPMLLIEEPESHMHPQMQSVFARTVYELVKKKASNNGVQMMITSHSAHMTHAFGFSHIRYAYREAEGFKTSIFDLNGFKDSEENNKFLTSYLKVSRCDLFFADKVIFVEGASERLLIPYIIDQDEYKGLHNQYYTMIEVGGAHAYKFVPLMEFLHIPYLIITDVDYIGKGESTKRPQAVDEEENATGTSNPSIKNWLEGKGINDIHALKDLKDEDKTWGLCGRIAFQEPEGGKTPRSLEPAIHAVNTCLKKYKEGSSKIDYALDIITNTELEKFVVPCYIDKGLRWLMNKR